MQTEHVLNLPFRFRHSDDRGGFAYAVDVEHAGQTIPVHATTYAPSPERAKSSLRAQLGELIADGLARKANWQRWIIGTRDGDILIVSFALGSWGYDIVGPGRGHASGCWGSATYEAAKQYARQHAESSFDGIEWEHAL